MTETAIVLGSGNQAFGRAVAELSHLPIIPIKIAHFPDGELRVSLDAFSEKEKVAGKRVIVIQSLGKNPNEYFIEVLLIADALRRAGSARIVLMAPYMAYSRQNLPVDVANNEARNEASVAARLFAQFMHEAGIAELITMDLHTEQTLSFYNFPVRHLTGRKALAEVIGNYCAEKSLKQDELVVVGPDLGSAKLVASFAEEFRSSFALLQKRRIDHKSVETLSLIGDVKEKNVLLADDMCSTGATLKSAAIACHGKGAQKIFAACTHGLLVDEAMRQIEDSPIEMLFVGDTVAIDKKALQSPKLCVVSMVPAFAASLNTLP